MSSLQFVEYSKPGMESGTYRVTVSQDLIVNASVNETFPEQSLDFVVIGERFSLNAQAIHAYFPPAGSTGRRTDVLPHIAIKRCSFPWERSAYDGGEDYEPWVALLLFEEMEVAKEEAVKQIIEASKLMTEPVKLSNGTTDAPVPKFPTITLEPNGQLPTDLVTVLDVKRKLLEKILPTWEELKLLAHIRKRSGGSDESERELAIVMGTRLPRGGSDSIMHLVALENRYDNVDKQFGYQDAGPDDYIRLVSLASWSFSSLPEIGKDFEELIEDLDTGTLAMPVPTGSTTAETDAQKYLSRGFVPVPHKFRECSTTYSWYHGPFVPYSSGTQFTCDADLPKFADALVQYQSDLGMFDPSYAAAFELGRAIALEDRTFASALFQWKLQENEKLKLAEQKIAVANIVGRRDSDSNIQDNTTLLTKLRAWMDDHCLLKGIPFNYLVPDERMLPLESIRFFQLDWRWIECFLYGAFTIGGYTRELTNNATDLFYKFKSLATKLYGSNKPQSGFLLRSQLVVDYPDLLVDIYDDAGRKLSNHRAEYLGKDILFALCDGVAATTEIYLKPEGLHFGLDEEENEGLVLDVPLDASTTASSPHVEYIDNVQVSRDSTLGDCFLFANQAYVDLRFPTVLKNPTIRSFSIAFWMKASDLSLKSPWTRVFDATWDSNNFVQCIVPEANKVQFAMKVDGTAYAQMSITLSPNDWYHLAGVWDAYKKELRVYVNGVLVAAEQGNLVATAGTDKNFILGKSSDGIGYFSGLLGRFNLFDRALTDEQVVAVKNATLMPKPRLMLPLNELTYECIGAGIDKISGAGLVTDTDMAYCMEFDGKSSYIKLRYVPEIFNNLATCGFSLSLWVNAKNLSANTESTCLLNASQNSDNFVQITVPEANKIQVTVRKAGMFFQKKSATISTGCWIHIGVIWNHQTSTLELYIDGQDAAGGGTGTPLAGSNECFELGRRAEGKGFFQGEMAYLRLYDRAWTAKHLKAVRTMDRICINTKRYEKDIKNLADPVAMDALIRDGGKRVVKVKTPEQDGLVDRISAALGQTEMKAAHFGMHMMEGSNKARIVKKP